MATRKSSAPAGSNVVTFTIPGLTNNDAVRIIEILQDRLNALNDLALTLKHVHWNVVGPNFIGVHTMIDPQVDAVRMMVDATAERIATLGGSPIGTPGALVASRTWDDYDLLRADALAHLAALDVVYDNVVKSHREAIDQTEKPDPVTQDLLIQQAAELEQFHWFVRAHLESADGTLATGNARREVDAARRTHKGMTRR
jgi:starvation-inducible DNA-binding protein